MIDNHAFYDGDEELLPKVIRSQLLESLHGHQTSRNFPVESEDLERALADNDEDDPPPDNVSKDTSGPSLNPEQKMNIKKIHNNCGHPSNTEFLRALRLSGAQGRVLAYVRKESKRSACEAKGHMPKARLPASIPRTFRFNETFGIDLAEVEDPWGTKHIFTNLVCCGTFLQLWRKTEGKTALGIAETMISAWVQFFGPRS